ncbi:tripartite tricarboxylate transporter substrate binding protein [Variovorax sp. J22R133]|uniref:Bug family tripartite tricarboxylate transporter substrate binding protein n=1 Tax=Variovorax brevis TaxID=3053503 RepID=UPI0025762FFA|nr:tripartite tricarboxylate transporter substrate binding protein [Variovorax sp. J22R133]MDM0117391.1 tripartite tricarboxylate transporter substrate binding protein [Variovorax sp. J22R133]
MSVNISMRSFLRTAAFGMLACVAGVSGAQQAFPAAKPVSLIVPYPAGGPSDAGARAFATPFGEAIGQSTIVENQGGATGTIAANKTLAAAADGYNVFYGSPNEVILAPMVNSAVKFKPEDFTLVHPISTLPLVLLTRNDLKVNSLDEFIDLSRKSTKTPLSFGSVGIGSLYHVVTEYLGRKVGAQYHHIPYKGSAQVLTDLAGGQIDFAILPYQASIDGMVKDKRMQLISSFSRTLPPGLKHVKSVSESKLLTDFEFTVWGGIFVKTGTPDAILATLRNGTVKALANPELRKRMEAEGRVPFDANSKEQVAELQKAQIAAYRTMIKTVDFKLSN